MCFRSLGRHVRTAASDPQGNDDRDRPRALRTTAVIALITVAAISALSASTAASSHTTQPAARQRTTYLQPVGTLVREGYLPFPALLGDTGTVGVPAGTKAAPTRPDPAVAARQAPTIAQFEGASGTLTPAGIATLALEHGCDPSAAPTATAIAMAESGGSPSAQGDVGLMTDVWDWSAGLWQIRGLRAQRGTGGLRDSIANQDAGTNAAAMYTVSRGCADWTPWSTYDSGAYEAFLPLAAQAVRYVVGYFRAHGHYPPVPAPDPTATLPVQGSAGMTSANDSTATPLRHPTSSPKQASSSPAQATAPTTGASASQAPASSAPSDSHIVSPVPTLPTTSIPIPTPSVTLPLPSPSISLPGLPGLP